MPPAGSPPSRPAWRRRRVRPAAARRRRPRRAEPPLPRLPARHGRRARNAAARPGSDSFWTWRETMYRFVGRLDAGGGRGGRRAALRRAAGSAASPASPSSTTCTTSRTARPMPTRPRWRCGISRRRGATGIGLTLLPMPLPPWRHLRRRPPAPGQRRFLNDLDGFAAHRRRRRAARRAATRRRAVGVAPHSCAR